MEVDVAVEGGAVAVEEGDGAEPRAEGRLGVGVMHRADRAAEPPLDLVEEDPREGGDGRRPKMRTHRDLEAFIQLKMAVAVLFLVVLVTLAAVTASPRSSGSGTPQP
jgi:hypothetical protein